MPAEEQQLLFENTARAMGDSELFIKQRHVRNCYKADPAYGTGVAKALGIDLQEALKELSAITFLYRYSFFPKKEYLFSYTP